MMIAAKNIVFEQVVKIDESIISFIKKMSSCDVVRDLWYEKALQRKAHLIQEKFQYL